MIRSALVTASLLLPAVLAAQAPDPAVSAAVDRLTPTITQIRHRLHQNPELSNREFRTAELVAAHLRSLGMEVRTGVAHTGVVGILRGGRPGPVIAVRADMDALPVREETPYEFRSTATGEYLGSRVPVSHACGHDIHTAVQMGVASVLTPMREQLAGTVIFVFQPAEEGAPPGEEGGAALMLREKVFGDLQPEAVIGLHTLAQLEVGKVAFTPGPAMAASDRFIAVIRGRQSHGASPHLAVDPVVMASQAVLALQTIRSRTLSPIEPGVVTVGVVRGGDRFNIIPDTVVLMGTVRTFDRTVQDQVETRMREIMDGVTRAGGGSFTLDYHRTTPVTVNHDTLTRRLRPTLERVLGAGNVVTIPPTTVAEDFAFFANTAPGFFYRLGTTRPGTTSGDHHTPTFMADDSAIPVGMRVMTSLVLDYLAGTTGGA